VTSERHGPPLSELVGQKHANLQAIGDENFARVFFFFQEGRGISVTNGYVKKQRKVDTGELEQARTYKKDWEKQQLLLTFSRSRAFESVTFFFDPDVRQMSILM
jgi:hypothetical protein